MIISIFRSDGRSWRHLKGKYHTTKAADRPTGLDAVKLALARMFSQSLRRKFFRCGVGGRAIRSSFHGLGMQCAVFACS